MTTARGILRPWFTAAAVALSAAAARAQSLEGERGVPMEVRSLSATATIEGRVARVALDETFFNPSGREIEATFTLPLPEGAAVERFSMWVEGVETAGEILDSGRARGVYEGIVRTRKDPGLLETDGGRVFRARVFPVPARGEKRVRISWTEVLPADGGSATWRLPMRRAGRASVAVDVASDRPLSSAWSPTHAVDVVRKDDRHARVSFEATDLKADRDFVLVLQEPSDALGFSFLASRPAGEAEGSFLVVLSPAVVPGEKPVPRDVVICCDTSGSMAGAKIGQARGALSHAVSTLSPEDRFSIVAFATEPRAFRDGLVPATPENLEAARAFVASLEAVGGTAIDDALARSLGMLAGGDAARPAVVLFLTDGLPTMGETDPAKVIARAKAAAGDRVRLFTFGVGNDVNTTLLDTLAADLRGARDYVAPEEDIEAKVSALVAKTRFPVITDLRLEVEGAAVSGLYPRRLPDLFRGTELVVAGRYAGPGEATVRVRGRSRDGERLFERKVSFPARTDGAGFVDRLWAVRRVGHLLDEIRLKGTLPELRDEVVRLAKKHAIVTPYTSYLVLEPGADRRLLGAAGNRAGGREGELAAEVIETRPIDEQEQVLETPQFADSIGDPRHNSDAPFEGTGTNEPIGTGGGAGGMFGGRRGGRRNLRLEGGAGTEGAVEAGLEWLKNHQSPGGFWDVDGFEAMCRKGRCGGAGAADADVGATGLATLAFLGYGETHKTPRYGAVLRSALKYLKRVQDAEGCFGPRTSPRRLLDHALASLAMTEAYGLTQSPLFKASAQNGVNFILQSRDPVQGWGDPLLTGWMVMALKSARGAGLDVDPAALDAARTFLEATVDPATGRVGAPGRTESLTAESILARIFCGAARDDALVRKGVDLCLASLPIHDEAAGLVDHPYWYFGTLAMFQVGGEPWKRWNEAMKKAVVEKQRSEAADDRWGSWDPVGPMAAEYGRIGATALNEMCLEVYYRYARVFGAHGTAAPKPASETGEDAVKASKEAKKLSEANSADEGE